MEREQYKRVKIQMEEELERENARGEVLEDELNQATASRDLHKELVQKLSEQLNQYKSGANGNKRSGAGIVTSTTARSVTPGGKRRLTPQKISR